MSAKPSWALKAISRAGLVLAGADGRIISIDAPGWALDFRLPSEGVATLAAFLQAHAGRAKFAKFTAGSFLGHPSIRTRCLKCVPAVFSVVSASAGPLVWRYLSRRVASVVLAAGTSLEDFGKIFPPCFMYSTMSTPGGKVSNPCFSTGAENARRNLAWCLLLLWKFHQEVTYAAYQRAEK